LALHASLQIQVDADFDDVIKIFQECTSFDLVLSRKQISEEEREQNVAAMKLQVLSVLLLLALLLLLLLVLLLLALLLYSLTVLTDCTH
jgi:uncharacterized membrane protein